MGVSDELTLEFEEDFFPFFFLFFLFFPIVLGVVYRGPVNEKDDGEGGGEERMGGHGR